jgi:hypothetical protein
MLCREESYASQGSSALPMSTLHILHMLPFAFDLDSYASIFVEIEEMVGGARGHLRCCSTLAQHRYARRSVLLP